eukprot:SM000116S24249  [mRNA]  locus=s116:408819:411005:+ [translate_table: standard]
MAPSVASLFVYPVKSCRGLSLPRAHLATSGFAWDRQWMVVNERGRMRTQRTDPALALVRPALPQLALDDAWAPLDATAALCETPRPGPHFSPPSRFLWLRSPTGHSAASEVEQPPAGLVAALTAPGMEPLHVLLAPPYERPRVPASVWEWSGHALDEGDDAAAWFTTYLGKPSRLVRFAPGELRPTDPDYAEGSETCFSDGFPFLVISQASLDALNQHMEVALPINRFRPNIFIDGCEAFEEDTWRAFTIGGVAGRIFRGVKPCGRCKVTTTNQATGEVGEEPLKTLAVFRKGSHLQLPKNMWHEKLFGMNAICNFSGGPAVAVGEAICILDKASSVAELVPG